MLLKIEHEGESNLIETQGRVQYGPAYLNGEPGRVRVVADHDDLRFEMRSGYKSKLPDAPEQPWFRITPDLMFFDINQPDRIPDGIMYLNWASFVDAGDQQETLVVFERGYIMNQSGKTIEVLR